MEGEEREKKMVEKKMPEEWQRTLRPARKATMKRQPAAQFSGRRQGDCGLAGKPQVLAEFLPPFRLINALYPKDLQSVVSPQFFDGERVAHTSDREMALH